MWYFHISTASKNITFILKMVRTKKNNKKNKKPPKKNMMIKKQNAQREGTFSASLGREYNETSWFFGARVWLPQSFSIYYEVNWYLLY